MRLFRSLFLIQMVLAAVALCAVCSVPLYADEIESFHSDITVHEDSTMTVVETIRVYSSGDEIKHGIYRDFPTRYRGKWLVPSAVGFEVTRVLRDGHPEPFSVTKWYNGKRIYIGNPSIILPPGYYTYTITYKTDHQLGYFKKHDELYWNVTGNGWTFPIKAATATVHLPRGIAQSDIRVAAYTGPFGSKDRNCHCRASAGQAQFETTTLLNQHEGLTIVVGWPKGIVHGPDKWTNLKTSEAVLFSDSPRNWVWLVGLLVVLAYYLIAWKLLKRISGVTSTAAERDHFADLSPAALRFITRTGYDDKAFAVALINMAAKGFLKIENEHNRFKLTRISKEPQTFSPEEQIIADLLKSSSSIFFDTANHKRIRETVKAFKQSLIDRYEGQYYVSSKIHKRIGMCLSLAVVLVCMMLTVESVVGAIIHFIFPTIFTAASVRLVRLAINNLKRSGGCSVVVIGIVSLWFCIGTIFLIFSSFSFSALISIALLIVLNLLFSRLLRIYTIKGQGLAKYVEDFKAHLVEAMGESDQEDKSEQASDALSRLLPYAIALDIKDKQIERLSDSLSKALAGSSTETRLNRQRLHRYRNLHYTASNITSAVSIISSSSGSGSGSGGGGSSGGGGGGGGGGGW